MTITKKATLIAACGQALLLTMVTGSRVTSSAGIAGDLTLAIGLAMLVTSFSCVGFGIASGGRADRLRPILLALFPAAGLIGCLLLWLVPQSPLILGNSLLGLSIGCGYLLWGEAMTCLDRRAIITANLVSSAIWGVASSLLTLLDVYEERMGVLIGIVVLDAILCLAFLQSVKPAGLLPTSCAPACDPTGGRTEAAKLLHEVLPIIWQPMLLVSVLGFSSGILRVLNASDGVDPSLLSFVRVLCTIIVLLVFLIASRHAPLFEQRPLSLGLLIAAASALLLLPIVDPRFRVLVALIIDVAYLLAGIFLAVACALTGRNVQGASMLAAGIGEGVSIFFITAGFGLSSAIGSAGPDNIQGIWLLALAAVYAIAIVLLMLNLPRLRHHRDTESLVLSGEGYERASVRKGSSSRPQTDEPPTEHSQRVVHLVLSVPETALRTNQTLTETYRITNREMDVLILTLSGRNASAIAQMLFVSEETVRTHLKHIYKKLDIHSKEELHRLVETVLSD